MTAPSERMSDTAGTESDTPRTDAIAHSPVLVLGLCMHIERALAAANKRGDRWSLLAQEQDAQLTAKAAECERLRAALAEIVTEVESMNTAGRSSRIRNTARKALKGE